MGFDITLKWDEGHRRAFRTSVPGLTVRIGGSPKDIAVKDFSATGIAVAAGSGWSDTDSTVKIKLLLNGKLFLDDLKARVVRLADAGIIALDFMELDRRKQGRLDKLALEVQKRIIDLKKRKKAEK